ncbi:MAG TPA: APC family permease [Bacillota bacterium]|nr:APC family permease [Bacillota bacterium]
MEEKIKLKRILGFPATYGAAVGLVVSGTAMFSVGNVGAISGNATFICAAIALIPMMSTAFAFGELTAMLPGGGMISDYTAPALGRFWATFALLSGYVVLIACDGGTQLVMGGLAFEDLIGVPQAAVSIALLVIIICVNVFGVQFYGGAQAAITWTMMIVFLILGIVGSLGTGEALGVATPIPENAGLLPEGGWPTVFGAVGTAVWFFIGFEFACPLAEENKKPYKYVPWALILGLITIYVVDIIFVYGAVKYTDLGVMATSSVPHVDAASAVLGPAGGIIMGLLTIFASFTTGNDYVCALPRMLYGMARENLVPKVFAKLHPKYRVSMYGIFFTVCLILLVLIYVTVKGGTSDAILTLINTACITWLIAYIIAMVDVLVLRKKYPDFPRLFKVPAAGIVLPIGMLGAVYAIYTLSYVLMFACILMAIIAAYAIIWNKAHGLPVNDKVPIEKLVKDVRDRSEYLAVWDEAVEEWMKKRDALQ